MLAPQSPSLLPGQGWILPFIFFGKLVFSNFILKNSSVGLPLNCKTL